MTHEEYKEARRLRAIAYSAVRKLPRPDRCCYCETVGPVEGHHEDYTKPTEVIWLCKKCHLSLHKATAIANGKKWGQHNGTSAHIWAEIEGIGTPYSVRTVLPGANEPFPGSDSPKTPLFGLLST